MCMLMDMSGVMCRVVDMHVAVCVMSMYDADGEYATSNEAYHDGVYTYWLGGAVAAVEDVTVTHTAAACADTPVMSNVACPCVVVTSRV